MLIHLTQLREGPFEYDVNFSPTYLMEGCEESDLRFEAGTGTVVFRLVGKEVVAEGELETTVHGACGRCLAPASATLKVPVHLFYWPRNPEHEASKIEDIDPAEPDFGLYDGDALDPDEDLREVLLVEAPDVFLCREDCRGLCPHCGANLNEGPCSCPPEEEAEAQEGAAPPDWKKQLRSLKLPPES
jgi:uncharacterized metal-binding protein YceD (DUF177 family)